VKPACPTALVGALRLAMSVLCACADPPLPSYTCLDPRDRITIADQQTEGRARIPTWDGSTLESATYRHHHLDQGHAGHLHDGHNHR